MSLATIDKVDTSTGSMAAITGGHLQNFQEWARVIAVGSVIPDALRGKPADVFICVMHGLDLGLRPMQALNMVYVVKGRPSLSAEGMRALLVDQGHEINIKHLDAEKCVIEGRRKGTQEWRSADFTMAQAKKAKLSGANWDAYPEDMLLARATTRLCKRYFADVTNGLSSVEEILDEQTPAPVVSLAQAAAARTQVATPAAPVDDQAEAERLRAEVLAAEQQFVAPPAGVDALTGEILEGEIVEEPDVPGWGDVQVATPGSKA